MDSEEEIMSESEEYGFENSSGESFTSLQCTGDSQTMTQIYEQPLNHLLRHGNLVLEDPTSSEKSWTDEKHSLYLNSIEEAFVSSLYHGYYTYPCKRLQADRGVAVSVFSTDLNEEVESAYTEDSQSESETPPNVQNDSKKGRLKDIRCSNEAFQERDINERRKKRKLQQEIAVPDRGEIRHVMEEVSSAKHNHEHRGQGRFTRDRNGSENLIKTFSNSEDQVVPYMDDTSHRENGKP
ncbi:hypothetical protein KI387_027532 [Taxus chinensis]|uniref:Uncharacterized protein n=1 Tax=Taxus chinensis TaxID=29808 RepID=A0AA38FXE2_TAXCH|nr:hypothetical protein KI387_027532 [Taxus chinensis]